MTEQIIMTEVVRRMNETQQFSFYSPWKSGHPQNQPKFSAKATNFQCALDVMLSSSGIKVKFWLKPVNQCHSINGTSKSRSRWSCWTCACVWESQMQKCAWIWLDARGALLARAGSREDGPSPIEPACRFILEVDCTSPYKGISLATNIWRYIS